MGIERTLKLVVLEFRHDHRIRGSSLELRREDSNYVIGSTRKYKHMAGGGQLDHETLNSATFVTCGLISYIEYPMTSSLVANRP